MWWTAPLPASMCHRVLHRSKSHEGAIVNANYHDRVGCAKNVFETTGFVAAEKVVVRERLDGGQVLEFFKSLPPC